MNPPLNPLVKAPMIGETRNQELLSKATTYVYRQTEKGDLLSHFFFPPDFDYQNDSRPAIVFFHGGVWDISASTQFIPQGHHFASRGMVAIAVEYRTRAHLDGSPEDSIADAKAALSFFKYHATGLGLDPERIVAVGASAGANAALCAALHPHPDESFPHPRPAALILFGPVTDTSPNGVGNDLFTSSKNGKLLSPLAHLPQKKLPPCLILHGQADRVVPLDHSMRFAKRYRKRRNHCEVMEFRNAGHTFFNFNSDERNYRLTLHAADHFLVEQGLLDPDPLEDVMH